MPRLSPVRSICTWCFFPIRNGWGRSAPRGTVRKEQTVVRLTLSFALFAVGVAAATPAESIEPAPLTHHPRTVDVKALRMQAQLTALLRNRKSSDLALTPIEQVDGEAMPQGTAAREAYFARLRATVGRETDAVLRMALAAAVLQDDSLLLAVKQRVLRIAGWDPRGTTGFFQHDQSGRSVAWTLALAYDWLYDQWSPEERKTLLAAIRPRVEDMLSLPVQGLPTGWAGLDWGRKLDRWPYDSHGAVTLARLAVICTVLSGEDELFDRCAKAVVPRYLARPIPWGETGGYANGTAYAQWDVLYTHFSVWSLLKNALGVDLWQSDWAKGYLNFMAYFLPPGAPSGLFGDETEKRFADVWATQAKVYAAHRPSPLADWYARNQFGEKPLHLALMLAPWRDFSQVPGPLPSGTPQAVHLADIGWVAMHSDLGDRGRTSVYFKSSPYGSYNHSHADQNAFVIHAGGRVLAADSGYYDYYGSPHWKDWYKQTRAHNAITFDGGQGQLVDTMKAGGRISHFESTRAYDLVTGDATEGYGGALTRAVRSMAFLRPGTVLVFDALASDQARTWEWNLHALTPMTEKGPRALEIEQNDVRLCVTMLEAPEGAFAQTDRFTTEPQGNYPRQWHARYITAAKSREAVFLALLDVGCLNPEVEKERLTKGLNVSVKATAFAFAADGTVRRKQ